MIARPRLRSLPRPIAVAAALILLGGCTARAGYPSLALRPIEDISLAEPAPKPRAMGLSPAEAEARYAPLLARVREADASFSRALSAAKPVLARGRDAPMGSGPWGDAQQAYSRVAATRGDVVQAVSTLQSEAESPEAQEDPALAAAAARAIDTARAIDAGEAAALHGLEPRAT